MLGALVRTQACLTLKSSSLHKSELFCAQAQFVKLAWPCGQGGHVCLGTVCSVCRQVCPNKVVGCCISISSSVLHGRCWSRKASKMIIAGLQSLKTNKNKPSKKKKKKVGLQCPWMCLADDASGSKPTRCIPPLIVLNGVYTQASSDLENRC